MNKNSYVCYYSNDKTPRQLKIGGRYRHFKGSIYEVENLAVSSETEEEYVVYRCVDAPPHKLSAIGTTWIRKLSEFMGVVDADKYPKATQKYRFELIDK